MDPATIPGGMREGIEHPATHHKGAKVETRRKYKASLNKFMEPEAFKTVAINQGHLLISPQPSASSLRHHTSSGITNINMPTTYERIQAYRPPPYVSPYGGTQPTTIPSTNRNLQSIRESKGPRPSREGDPPPWLCCFAQRQVPEWDRHKETWNSGTESSCTVHPCQHKKCEDCLWESLEELPGVAQAQNQPPSKQKESEGGEQEATGVDEEPENQETNPLENTGMMVPPSMPASKGINRDPRTGRPRLWTKD